MVSDQQRSTSPAPVPAPAADRFPCFDGIRAIAALAAAAASWYLVERRAVAFAARLKS
jgi:hypothetical protein